VDRRYFQTDVLDVLAEGDGTEELPGLNVLARSRDRDGEVKDDNTRIFVVSPENKDKKGSALYHNELLEINGKLEEVTPGIRPEWVLYKKVHPVSTSFHQNSVVTRPSTCSCCTKSGM